MKKILLAVSFLTFFLPPTYGTNKEEKENILMYWSSGYFGEKGSKPVGGKEEICKDFVESVQKESPNFHITFITSQKDWKKLTESHLEVKERLSPLFIEDMIHVLTKGELPEIDINNPSSRSLKVFFQSLQSEEHKEICAKFYKKNKKHTPYLQNLLEESQTIPSDRSIFPDFKTLQEPEFLNHYIAFMIRQGLYGNPAMTSDFLRYFYGLYCSKEENYTYVDIDTFLAVRKNHGSFSDYLNQHINYINKKTSQEPGYYLYKGTIDFILKRNIFSKKKL